MEAWVLFIISVLSGILSGIFVWADKLEDVRLSLNDLYMGLLGTGWVFLFKGLFYKRKNYILIGISLIIGTFILIRKQVFIRETQFKKGMIPHYSMGIFVSRKLLEKNLSIPQDLKELAIHINESQKQKLNILKKLE